MTAQIPDTVVHDGRAYLLSRSRGSGLFQPEDHGLPVVMASTACWRGHACEYRVHGQALLLATLEANVGRYDDDDTFIAVAPPVIDGAAGEPGNPPFNTIYRELGLPIRFTGQLVLGADPIDELVSSAGLPEPWQCRAALLLTFDAGALRAADDITADMEALRAQLAGRPGAIPRLDRLDLAWLVAGPGTRPRG